MWEHYLRSPSTRLSRGEAKTSDKVRAYLEALYLQYMKIILVRSWSLKVCYCERVTDVMNFSGQSDRYVERETTKYFAHIQKQTCMENNFSFACFTWFWAPAIKIHCLLSINWLTWACMLDVPTELWAWTPLWTLPTPLINMTVGSPQERSRAISILDHKG